jgi:CRISPR/Cas system CSM-associated protein Csm3 (group 7 of RAMP superfamily)
MGKVELRIELRIQFYNNFYIGGGTGNGNIQAYLLRDFKGLPYIPAATLKGCIAQSACTLSECFKGIDCDYLFGKAGNQHGCLYFENGKLEQEELFDTMAAKLIDLKTGIQISRVTKTNRAGQLYTMETSGQGGAMIYGGAIQGFLLPEEYQRNVQFLVAAIRFIFALGGSRSAGLGWLARPIQCIVYKDGQQFSVYS